MLLYVIVKKKNQNDQKLSSNYLFIFGNRLMEALYDTWCFFQDQKS